MSQLGRVTISQIRRADREIFAELDYQVKPPFSRTADGTYPLAAAFKAIVDGPRIAQMITFPARAASSSSSSDATAADVKRLREQGNAMQRQLSFSAAKMKAALDAGRNRKGRGGRVMGRARATMIIGTCPKPSTLPGRDISNPKTAEKEDGVVRIIGQQRVRHPEDIIEFWSCELGPVYVVRLSWQFETRR